MTNPTDHPFVLQNQEYDYNDDHKSWMSQVVIAHRDGTTKIRNPRNPVLDQIRRPGGDEGEPADLAPVTTAPNDAETGQTQRVHSSQSETQYIDELQQSESVTPTDMIPRHDCGPPMAQRHPLVADAPTDMSHDKAKDRKLTASQHPRQSQTQQHQQYLDLEPAVAVQQNDAANQQIVAPRSRSRGTTTTTEPSATAVEPIGINSAPNNKHTTATTRTTDPSPTSATQTATHINANTHPKRYCICRSTRHWGKLIACDADDCAAPDEWYHLRCVGLNKSFRGDWICPECRWKAGGAAGANGKVAKDVARR